MRLFRYLGTVGLLGCFGLVSEAACGGSSSSPTTDAGSSGGDGSAGGDGAGGGVCPGGFPLGCTNGQFDCCPAGAPCRAPEPFCDLGGGACTPGPCGGDGGSDARAGDGGSFACGDKTCGAGQYCEDTNIPNHLDGGSTQAYACRDLPQNCVATPTCACVGCTPCSDSGGVVTCVSLAP